MKIPAFREEESVHKNQVVLFVSPVFGSPEALRRFEWVDMGYRSGFRGRADPLSTSRGTRLSVAPGSSIGAEPLVYQGYTWSPR